jgi:hypothetical protein
MSWYESSEQRPAPDLISASLVCKTYAAAAHNISRRAPVRMHPAAKPWYALRGVCCWGGVSASKTDVVPASEQRTDLHQVGNAFDTFVVHSTA